jgi:hypothetical protein
VGLSTVSGGMADAHGGSERLPLRVHIVHVCVGVWVCGCAQGGGVVMVVGGWVGGGVVERECDRVSTWQPC